MSHNFNNSKFVEDQSEVIVKLMTLDQLFNRFAQKRDTLNCYQILNYMRSIVGEVSYSLYRLHKMLENTIIDQYNTQNKVEKEHLLDIYNQIGITELFIDNLQTLLRSKESWIQKNTGGVKSKQLSEQDMQNLFTFAVKKIISKNTTYHKLRNYFLGKLDRTQGLKRKDTGPVTPFDTEVEIKNLEVDHKPLEPQKYVMEAHYDPQSQEPMVQTLNQQLINIMRAFGSSDRVVQVYVPTQTGNIQRPENIAREIPTGMPTLLIMDKNGREEIARLSGEELNNTDNIPLNKMIGAIDMSKVPIVQPDEIPIETLTDDTMTEQQKGRPTAYDILNPQGPSLPQPAPQSSPFIPNINREIAAQVDRKLADPITDLTPLTPIQPMTQQGGNNAVSFSETSIDSVPSISNFSATSSLNPTQNDCPVCMDSEDFSCKHFKDGDKGRGCGCGNDSLSPLTNTQTEQSGGNLDNAITRLTDTLSEQLGGKCPYNDKCKCDVTCTCNGECMCDSNTYSEITNSDEQLQTGGNTNYIQNIVNDSQEDLTQFTQSEIMDLSSEIPIHVGGSNQNQNIITMTDLSDETVSESTTQDNVVVEKYYVDWCGHCQTLAPIWEELKQKYQSKGIQFKDIDCEASENEAIAKKIDGYPTIKVDVNGDKLTYNGPRDQKSLEDLIENFI